jgi:hypothetical protein
MTSVELSVVEQASKPMILDDEGVQVKKDSDDIAADSHTSLSYVSSIEETTVLVS